MAILPQYCLEKGCKKSVHRSTGYCPAHQKAYVSNHRKERLPPPSVWERIRQTVFIRDNWTCYICKSNTPPADTIDHIQRGDNHDLDNLAPVHDRNAPHCHRSKTGREGAASRAKRTEWGTYWQNMLNKE